MRVRSLGARLATWNTATVLVTTAIVAGFSIATAQHSSRANAVAEAVATSEAQAARVSGELTRHLAVAEALARSLSSVGAAEHPLALNRHGLAGLLHQTIASEPLYNGIYTNWEADAFDGKDAELRGGYGADADGKANVYFYRDQAGTVCFETSPENDCEDATLDENGVRAGEWYLRPRETKAPCAVDPYLYDVAGTQVLMTSLSAPVLRDGAFVGIVGLDVALADLQKTVDSAELFGGAAKLSLVSPLGLLAAASGQSESLGSKAPDELLQLVERLGGSSDLVSEYAFVEGHLVVCAPVAIGSVPEPWHLLVSVPEAVINRRPRHLPSIRQSRQQLPDQASGPRCVPTAGSADRGLLDVGELRPGLNREGSRMDAQALGDILLIGDDPLHADLVMRAFARSHCEAQLTVAQTVAEASDRLAGQAWALIIADWRLPDGDALTLLGDRPPADRTPFVVMTSHGDERLAVEVMRAGAIDYVVKSAEALREMPHTAARAMALARQKADLQAAQQALAVSEALFESVVQAVPDIIYRLDADGRITFISHAVTRYGWQPEELLGRHVLELVHPDDRDRASFRLNERRTGQRASRLTEFRLLPKGSVERFFELHSQSDLPVMLGSAEGMYASDPPMTGSFLGTQGIARDITERRLAETQLRRLAAAVEGSGDGLVIIDNAGLIVFANQASEALTGVPLEEQIGRHHRDSVVPVPTDATALAAEADMAAGRDWTWHGKVCFTTGHEIVLDATGTLLRDDAGQQTGWLIRMTDVSERARLEEQLTQAARLEALATLAGGIAHDFNNALAAIMGYAELASVRISGEHEAQDDLEQILVAAQRAGDVTKQVLAFARQSEPRRQVQSLAPLLRESLKLLRATLPPWVTVVDRVDRDLPMVSADTAQMHQVIMNLCTNAVHAIGEAPGVLTVAMRLADPPRSGGEIRGGRWLAVEVRDTGSGIPPEVLDRIFEPFYTTKPAGKGTGLGLSTVHGIVSDHGGSIDVQSELGQGTTFRVYLPCADAEAARAEVGLAREARPARIMVVDDETALTRMWQRMLESQHHEVLVCNNPFDALERLRDAGVTVDLLLVDHLMPGMSGLDLVAEVRPRRPHLPVILLTGHRDEPVGERAAALQPCAVVGKPIRMQALADAVAEALSDRSDSAVA